MPVLPRKTVLELSPYPAPNFSRYKSVRLDFNENTVGFPASYPSGIAPEVISAYPEYYELMAALCKHFDVSSDSVLITNGSDEGLMMVSTTFIEPGAGDVAVLSKPCFVVMPHTLKFAGAALREVRVRPDMSFDVDGLEQALMLGARIAMFATPENPTGAILPPDVIRRFCTRFPDTLFVIGEAYGEYSGTTVLPFINELPNLMVLKTFSKAWGMAGLRLGLVFAQPYLIDYLNRVRSPFNVNSLAVQTAIQLISNSAAVMDEAGKAMERKRKLEVVLSEMGYKLVVGGSNSFLLGLGIDAARFEAFCRGFGVLVRNRSESVYPGNHPSPLWGYVRVSTGTEQENSRFLEVLADYEKSRGGRAQLLEECYPDSCVGEGK